MRKHALRVVLVVAAAYGVVVTAAWIWAHAGLSSRTCPPQGALVQVDTEAGVLCLCRNGQADGRFRAAFGRGGVGKMQEGDGKTPLGRYRLGPGWHSSRFHLFLPVGYPSSEQVTQGYSGGAIGIHGPHVAFRWLRHATVWANWTQGCIAVGTAGEVEQIAQWVRDAGATEILLL